MYSREYPSKQTENTVQNPEDMTQQPAEKNKTKNTENPVTDTVIEKRFNYTYSQLQSHFEDIQFAVR